MSFSRLSRHLKLTDFLVLFQSSILYNFLFEIIFDMFNVNKSVDIKILIKLQISYELVTFGKSCSVKQNYISAIIFSTRTFSSADNDCRL